MAIPIATASAAPIAPTAPKSCLRLVISGPLSGWNIKTRFLQGQRMRRHGKWEKLSTRGKTLRSPGRSAAIGEIDGPEPESFSQTWRQTPRQPSSGLSAVAQLGETCGCPLIDFAFIVFSPAVHLQ